MPRRLGSLRRNLRHLCAAALMAAVALPELAFATTPKSSGKSLDAMTDAELERFVQGINETANWRKYRRPGDPPDFVPGAPVKVMFGAGAAFGRSGGGRSGAFRKSGVGARRGSVANRRRGGREENTSALGSSRGSRGSSSRSGTGNSSGNSNSNFGTTSNQGSAFGDN